MICIVGYGNMGKRYGAICRNLDIDYIAVDENDEIPLDKKFYIISTPTDTHTAILQSLIISVDEPANFLVEKPISKNPQHLDVCINLIQRYYHNVYMVNNYAYYDFALPKAGGLTVYDYYNSGRDGLAYDCIQLIHLADGEVKLGNDNPIWKCKINGLHMNREKVDWCYIRMIEDFYSEGKKYGKLWGVDDIIAAHNKVMAYEKSLNSNTGKKLLDKIAQKVQQVCW